MRAGILALRDTGRCTSDPSDSDISCCVCMRGKKTHLFALRAPYFRGHPPRNDPISSSIAFLASVPGSWSSMDPPPHNSTGKAESAIFWSSCTVFAGVICPSVRFGIHHISGLWRAVGVPYPVCTLELGGPVRAIRAYSPSGESRGFARLPWGHVS